MFGAFVILVSFLAFMLVGSLLAIPFFGFEELKQMQNMGDLNDTNKMNLLKFMQVIQAFGLFIVPPIILAYLYNGNSKNYLFLNKSINGASVVSVFIIMFVMTPLVTLISEFNSNLSLPEWMSGVENWMQKSENQAAEITQAFLHVSGFSG